MKMRIYNMFELHERKLNMDDVVTYLTQVALEAGFEFQVLPEDHRLELFKVRRLTKLYDELRGRPTAYLRPKDWVAFFDIINQGLDDLQLIAIVDTGLYRIRIGTHKRVTYDDQVHRFSSVFEFRASPEHKFGKPEDYSDSPETVLMHTKGFKLQEMLQLKQD